MNENPLIMDNPADTLEELRVRLTHVAQWAENDEEYRALLQDLRMMLGTVIWLQSEHAARRNYHK